MDEKIFYESKNVSVTQSRLIAGDKTYAMGNISSVEIGILKPSTTFQILLLILGVILAIPEQTRILGIILALIGGVWLYSRKTWYSVRISSNSGESDSITSKDKDYISEIVKAVNASLIHRG